jgi:hypothetical protein
MTNSHCFFLLAAGLAFPAQAQSPPVDEQLPDPIVVQGERDPAKAIGKFVRALTPAPIGGQLARFEDPVCPVVLGMPATENGLVQDRLREVAAAIGMKIASPGCAPNLYVLVGRDKKEIIEGLDRQFPALLSGLSRGDVRDLIEIPGPVASWQILDRVGADGMPLSTARIGSDPTPVRVVWSVGSPSRISRQTKLKFVGTLITFEAKALNGVTTRQMADYAAMRTFAATDPGRVGPLPAQSILSLFDPGTAPQSAPESVTWWDYAFLRSLYASASALGASGQRSEMERQFAKELAKVPPEKR